MIGEGWAGPQLHPAAGPQWGVWSTTQKVWFRDPCGLVWHTPYMSVAAATAWTLGRDDDLPYNWRPSVISDMGLPAPGYLVGWPPELPAEEEEPPA